MSGGANLLERPAKGWAQGWAVFLARASLYRVSPDELGSGTRAWQGAMGGRHG